MGFLAALGPIFTVAGTAVSAIGASNQANYRAKVAANNAAIAEDNANKAAEAAQREQQRSDFEYADLISRQFSAQSASGLDVLGASQLRTRDLSGRVRGLAATDIRRQGEANTANLFQDAANFKAESNAARKESGLALATGVLKIGSTLVGSGLFKKRDKIAKVSGGIK